MTSKSGLWRSAILTTLLSQSLAAGVAWAAAGGCNTPPHLRSGFFVDTSATAGYKGASPKGELLCWVSKTSASGQGKATGQAPDSDMTVEYDYGLNDGALRASMRVYGAAHRKKDFQGTGAGHLWVQWRDTLKFYSPEMDVIVPKEFAWKAGMQPGTQATAIMRSTIHFRVKLLQAQPSCNGGNATFQYRTGVTAMGRDLMGAGVMLQRGQHQENVSANDQYKQEGSCDKPIRGIDSTDVLNGWEWQFNLSIQIDANSSLSDDTTPEGHLKVDMPPLRLCIVKPETPKNLQITSESGIDYVCK